ncbi:hypothetical protein CCACVL1_18899 [Corchorus capsularis]|uniref:Uncharacterized protein n=1 Tax=Corchorus capsularis TaxID=210143 RepID=A0A1R3HJM0_COCAP|nr:hypothetical protein CCACVL1_18899 [Corchorus capsularis]
MKNIIKKDVKRIKIGRSRASSPDRPSFWSGRRRFPCWSWRLLLKELR